MLPGPVIVSEPGRFHRADPRRSNSAERGRRIIENPPPKSIVPPAGHSGGVRRVEHVGGVVDRLDIGMAKFQKHVNGPGAARGVVGLGVLQMPLARRSRAVSRRRASGSPSASSARRQAACITESSHSVQTSIARSSRGRSIGPIDASSGLMPSRSSSRVAAVPVRTSSHALIAGSSSSNPCWGGCSRGVEPSAFAPCSKRRTHEFRFVRSGRVGTVSFPWIRGGRALV